MQKFKDTELENKIIDSVKPVFDLINVNQNSFFEDAYFCQKMGELIYDNALIPNLRAFQRNVFIRAFHEIFEAWSFCGTFETYIEVFKKIFGESALIEFTVPAKGHVQINIETSELETIKLEYKEIEGFTFRYGDILVRDEHGNEEPLLVRFPLGIETQQELEAIIFSMRPAGVYTEISLTIL